LCLHSTCPSQPFSHSFFHSSPSLTSLLHPIIPQEGLGTSRACLHCVVVEQQEKEFEGLGRNCSHSDLHSFNAKHSHQPPSIFHSFPKIMNIFIYTLWMTKNVATISNQPITRSESHNITMSFQSCWNFLLYPGLQIFLMLTTKHKSHGKQNNYLTVLEHCVCVKSVVSPCLTRSFQIRNTPQYWHEDK
jgi:hypothetical protein